MTKNTSGNVYIDTSSLCSGVLGEQVKDRCQVRGTDCCRAESEGCSLGTSLAHTNWKGENFLVLAHFPCLFQTSSLFFQKWNKRWIVLDSTGNVEYFLYDEQKVGSGNLTAICLPNIKLQSCFARLVVNASFIAPLLSSTGLKSFCNISQMPPIIVCGFNVAICPHKRTLAVLTTPRSGNFIAKFLYSQLANIYRAISRWQTACGLYCFICLDLI